MLTAISGNNDGDVFDMLFKVVVIGDCGVGKTCVVQRFKAGTYVERHGNTIGVDFSMKTVIVDGKKIKLQIWDTAGQERFRTITQSYYRSANGVVMVYDITKRSSFLSIQRWMEEVKRYTHPQVALILIGESPIVVSMATTSREIEKERRNRRKREGKKEGKKEENRKRKDRRREKEIRDTRKKEKKKISSTLVPTDPQQYAATSIFTTATASNNSP
ncbi:Small GTP-binding protein domain [Trinorchestia longiramus]|nr:Small GTP-binding protein domain [Trinorchestia longiramus]